ncbi:MAG: DUF1858 domain-containing protein [Chitinophagaceae bacterium]|nr:DUF1858 domain-containing protein [Chitinophagaceae bacterium]
MEITAKTYVSDILKEYGEMADLMELFGVERLGGYRLRRFLTRLITVRTAAIVHDVPEEEFIAKVQSAVMQKELARIK